MRLHPDKRRAAILGAALKLAKLPGKHYQRITRELLAEHADCSVGLVSYYYPTMPQLRRAIISAAIAAEDLAVLLQGLAAGEAKALAAPESMRAAAAEWLLS